MKITTEHCVDFARKKEEYEDTLPSQWKRRSKKKDGNTIVRRFELSRNGFLEEVVILENNGELSLETGLIQCQTPSSSVSLYENLKNNPIRVSLKPDFNTGELEEWTNVGANVSRKDFSGKTVFSIGEDGEEIIKGKLDWEENGIGFFCGPQTSDGYLSDTFSLGTAEKLEKLFDDFPMINGFPSVEIWAAENFHMINHIDGLTPKQAWGIVKDRLLRSGAIEDNLEPNNEEA